MTTLHEKESCEDYAGPPEQARPDPNMGPDFALRLERIAEARQALKAAQGAEAIIMAEQKLACELEFLASIALGQARDQLEIAHYTARQHHMQGMLGTALNDCEVASGHVAQARWTLGSWLDDLTGRA